MRHPILKAVLMGTVVIGLSGCISGKPHGDTYTNRDGTVSVIESDREQCERACNAENTRCGETKDARSNGGIHGPSGMFGASAECRDDLSSCLSGCKSR